jgi:hypothetical protein
MKLNMTDTNRGFSFEVREIGNASVAFVYAEGDADPAFRVPINLLPPDIDVMERALDFVFHHGERMLEIGRQLGRSELKREFNKLMRLPEDEL